MSRVVEATGKSIDDALQVALAKLGTTEEYVDVEVIDEGTKGFLGIGGKDAKIIVTEKDMCIEKTREYVTTICKGIGAKDITVSVVKNGDTVNVEVEGSDVGILIGKRGETLDAIQYLTSVSVNKYNSEEFVRVEVDAEHYRAKRKDYLSAIAMKFAEKALKYKKSMTLEPMTSKERRIVHEALQSVKGVDTHSVGDEPNRKVVISPVRNNRYGK